MEKKLNSLFINSSDVIFLKGLNGFRAIASLSVVISHIFMPEFGDFGLSKPTILKNFKMASFGVTLFFVISGFLITFLLLLELNKKGIVNIYKFYIRRALRIWPLYYLFMIVLILIQLKTSYVNGMFTNSIVWYMFFAANVPFILNSGIPIIVHYWSIGVEEQFYLVWPWIVKISKTKLLISSFTFLVVFIIAKLLTWRYCGSESIIYRVFTITRFDCMVIGATGAILFHANNKYYIRIATSFIAQISAWTLFICIAFNFIYLPAPIAHEIFAIICLVLIMGQITEKNRIINLNGTLADFLGKISYGIYVVHPLVILSLSFVLKNLSVGDAAKYFIIYCSAIISTILLSYISYRYYEKPFIDLKSRFTIIKSRVTNP